MEMEIVYGIAAVIALALTVTFCVWVIIDGPAELVRAWRNKD